MFPANQDRIVPFNIPARSSININIANGTSCFIQGFGLASCHFAFQAFVRVNGAIELSELYKGSSITYTKATNTLTIDNAAAGATIVFVTVYNGSVS